MEGRRPEGVADQDDLVQTSAQSISDRSISKRTEESASHKIENHPDIPRIGAKKATAGDHRENSQWKCLELAGS
jgi:hypothetical protein